MKKALGILVAVMALVMALSSCTPNGAPLTLVGKYYQGNVELNIEDDDTIKAGSKGAVSPWGKITKCDCKNMTVKVGNTEYSGTYELSGKTLTLSFDNAVAQHIAGGNWEKQ